MKAPSTDELVQLPEPIALQRYFDARNYRFFRLVVGLVIAISLVVTVQTASERHFGMLALALVDLIAAILLVLLRRERFYSLYFRQILLGFLAFQVVAVKVANLASEDSTTVFIPMMISQALMALSVPPKRMTVVRKVLARSGSFAEITPPMTSP